MKKSKLSTIILLSIIIPPNSKFLVPGLFIRSRVTISKLFREFWKSQNLKQELLNFIPFICIKSIIAILRDHLYNNSQNLF